MPYYLATGVAQKVRDLRKENLMEKIARADDYNFCLSLSLGQVGDCTRHLVIHRFGVEKDQQIDST